MNEQSWMLSPDAFAWVWRNETGLDEFAHPDPIRIDLSPQTEHDAILMEQHLRAAYPAKADQGLSAAMALVAAPTARIRCFGTLSDGTQVRTHAAIDRDHGVVLFQRSSKSTPTGPVRVVATTARLAPVHVAATLPPAAAGEAGRMVGYTPRVRGEQMQQQWNRDPDGRLPVDERIRKLLRLPRSAEGQLIIERDVDQQSPRPARYSSWIDVEAGRFGAGRYLIDVRNDETAVLPVDLPTLAAAVAERAGLGRVKERNR
ncbi:ESX secretion-associated protein EspG [Nocardia sp. IBHARD005]|uniref:ESX secretion-associated protein EspG n=1 Tax=Nocardia sp. IBHARD005 TaxID=3457765 RepID=UPI00405841DF